MGSLKITERGSNHLVAEWAPPSEPNGIIRKYTVISRVGEFHLNCYAAFTPGYTCRPNACIPDENLYLDTYVPDTSCSSGLLLDCISATYYSFISHGRLVSICIQQQTGDKLATILSSPIQDTCRLRQVDTSGYNLYPATCTLV